MTINDNLFCTERLNFRKIRQEDYPLGRELFCNPSMMKHLGEIWSPQTSDDAMDEWRREWGSSNYCYGIMELIENRIPVGLAGFSENTNPEEKGIELSWFILPEHQGSGYATEMTRGICRFVFDELKKKRIFAETSPENQAASRVLKKCGFSEAGVYNRKYDYLPQMEQQKVWELMNKNFK